MSKWPAISRTSLLLVPTILMGDAESYFLVGKASGLVACHCRGTSERTFRACASGGFDQLMSKQVDKAVPRKPATIPITRSLDNQAHHVTNNSLMAGQRTGCYQALCGHLISATALARPLGRPCVACIAIAVAWQQKPVVPPARCTRHGQHTWLWWILFRQGISR